MAGPATGGCRAACLQLLLLLYRAVMNDTVSDSRDEANTDTRKRFNACLCHARRFGTAGRGRWLSTESATQGRNSKNSNAFMQISSSASPCSIVAAADRVPAPRSRSTRCRTRGHLRACSEPDP